MRESHLEQVERWAHYVRNNPNWRKEHNKFINALFLNHEMIIEKLLKTPSGKEKIIKLYDIKNKKGYSFL